MQYMHRFVFRNRCMLCFCAVLISTLILCGCAKLDKIGGGGKSAKDSTDPNAPVRDNTPQVLVPESPGTVVYENEAVTIDASNTNLGYVVLNYYGANEKVKLQIDTPEGITCTYLVPIGGEGMVYPLTGGSGTYTITVLESVDAQQDLYAISLTQAIDVALDDEFLPYLYPNVYAFYATDTKAVAKGSELAADCRSDLEVIENVYEYVIKNITYDTAKAESVSYGYAPDADATLSSGTGICFDYASLMTVMLRTQRIPTKLEVGYVGEIYHAWISCYVAEIGWVANIIQFDGKEWSLMDPTLGASNKNNSSAVEEYIGDGSNYIVKYTY